MPRKKELRVEESQFVIALNGVLKTCTLHKTVPSFLEGEMLELFVLFVSWLVVGFWFLVEICTLKTVGLVLLS